MIRDTNRSIFTVAMLGVFGLGLWASPVAAQLPPWQRPPGADQTDLANSPHPNPLPEGEGALGQPAASHETPGPSLTPWSGQDYEQEGSALGFSPGHLLNLAGDSVHDRLWVRAEFLAWWTKGFQPLLC